MKLRIGLNAHKIKGPYGGVNQFGNVLETYLCSIGHEVFRSLVPQLDLILIISSQKHPKTTAFDIEAIKKYLSFHPKTAVVHRVNSLDEPRGQNLGVNQAILSANLISDYTIFVSHYIKDSFAKKGIDLDKPHSVILNGADEKIFYPISENIWLPGQKLRIVTHHWSENYLKGFDIYERLDLLLEKPDYHNVFNFCFIGNIPLGLELPNTRVYPPTWGSDLADLLRQNHVYLTAARHEAAGNHYIEGMRCGLPILYLNSGSLHEYCHPYGLEFTLLNFQEILHEMLFRYSEFKGALSACPYTGTRMAQQYENLFQIVVANKRAHPGSKISIREGIYYFFLQKPTTKFRQLKRLASKAFQYLKDK